MKFYVMWNQIKRVGDEISRYSIQTVPVKDTIPISFSLFWSKSKSIRLLTTAININGNLTNPISNSNPVHFELRLVIRWHLVDCCSLIRTWLNCNYLQTIATERVFWSFEYLGVHFGMKLIQKHTCYLLYWTTFLWLHRTLGIWKYGNNNNNNRNSNGVA